MPNGSLVGRSEDGAFVPFPSLPLNAIVLAHVHLHVSIVPVPFVPPRAVHGYNHVAHDHGKIVRDHRRWQQLSLGTCAYCQHASENPSVSASPVCGKPHARGLSLGPMQNSHVEASPCL